MVGEMKFKATSYCGSPRSARDDKKHRHCEGLQDPWQSIRAPRHRERSVAIH